MDNFKELYLDLQLSGQKVKHQVSEKHFIVDFYIFNVKMYKSLSDYNKINVDGYQGFHVFICSFIHMLRFHSCVSLREKANEQVKKRKNGKEDLNIENTPMVTRREGKGWGNWGKIDKRDQKHT